jgi:hypothetical protein
MYNQHPYFQSYAQAQRKDAGERLGQYHDILPEREQAPAWARAQPAQRIRAIRHA